MYDFNSDMDLCLSHFKINRTILAGWGGQGKVYSALHFSRTLVMLKEIPAKNYHDEYGIHINCHDNEHIIKALGHFINAKGMHYIVLERGLGDFNKFWKVHSEEEALRYFS